MKIAVVGSREWKNTQRVWDFINGLDAETIIVSGGARGVDAEAVNAAKTKGLGVIEFLADWRTFGKSAGYQRNYDIVNAADMLVAFWNGRSRGTKHSIDLARAKGIEVKVLRE